MVSTSALASAEKSGWSPRSVITRRAMACNCFLFCAEDQLICARGYTTLTSATLAPTMNHSFRTILLNHVPRGAPGGPGPRSLRGPSRPVIDRQLLGRRRLRHRRRLHHQHVRDRLAIGPRHETLSHLDRQRRSGKPRLRRRAAPERRPPTRAADRLRATQLI